MVISRWPDELLIGQCEQNINQGCWCLGFDIKRLFLSNLQLSQRAFLYLNSSSVHVVLGTHFDKSYREDQIGAWNRSCLWPFIEHQEKVSYKPRNLLSYLYIYLNQCEELFSNLSEANLKIYLKWSWKMM